MPATKKPAPAPKVKASFQDTLAARLGRYLQVTAEPKRSVPHFAQWLTSYNEEQEV